MKFNDDGDDGARGAWTHVQGLPLDGNLGRPTLCYRACALEILPIAFIVTISGLRFGAAYGHIPRLLLLL
ncbi:hypothetical protein MRB53_001567 [Persea americana]|uniref:Uncharacterized protein n=1 Tax=Persea americana TaxID=3435 RepID=A0ACC2MS85_PERAE|nr:hypothetical protein MRB53_001567 [Persea americana]